MGLIVIETRVVPATVDALMEFTRDDLRDYAETLDVDKGRNKSDTIRNLMASGKATLCASLGN